MIRTSINEKKKIKNQQKNKIDKDIQSLTDKLKQIRRRSPKLKQKWPLSYLNQSQRSLEIEKPKFEKGYQKKTIKWNCSAQSWTRDISPSHAIPKAQRFKQQKSETWQSFPEIERDLRAKVINENKSVKFPESLRPQLFTIQPNPSPAQYECKRYLEKPISPRNSMKSYVSGNPQQFLNKSYGKYHIPGGTIGKFNKYETIYRPHTNKLNYSQKIIAQLVAQSRDRKRNKDFAIRNYHSSKK